MLHLRDAASRRCEIEPRSCRWYSESCNGLAGGNFEFIEMIDDCEICCTIKMDMKGALNTLKPVEPV